MRAWLFGCLCGLVTFVAGVSLAVLAGIKFGSGTVVSLLPSLALLLAIIAFILGYRRQSRRSGSAERRPEIP